MENVITAGGVQPVKSDNFPAVFGGKTKSLGSSKIMPLALAAVLLFAFTYFAFALPAVTFISPTLSDNSTTGSNWIYVNLSSSEPLNQSLLEWGNTSGLFANVSMMNSSLTNLTWFANMTDLADGAYNYTVFAQNTSDEWNQTQRRFVYIDTTPPLITIQSPLNQTYSAGEIWFNMTANEALNWSAFSLDGAANVSLTNSSGNWNNLSAVAEGFHNVTFYANDTAGNIGSANVSFIVKIISVSINLDKYLYNPWEDIAVFGKAILNPDGSNVTDNSILIWLDGVLANITNIGSSVSARNGTWGYNRSISISDTVGNLTEYRMRITHDFSAEYSDNKIQQYCDDIRFTYNNETTGKETSIVYWVESCNLSDSGNASFLVKIPFLENNTNTTINMYYGNSGATNESRMWNNVSHLGIYGGVFDYNYGLMMRRTAKIISIATGGAHTCVLKSNGNIDCQGRNDYGQSDNYTGGDAIGVAEGYRHTCFLKSNGNVDCQGRNDYGEAADYNGGNAIGVVGGHLHTCILKSNGNVECYGNNAYGQSTDYNGGDATGIAAGGGPGGYGYTCILKSNGNVECYGYNSDGQSDDYTGGDAIGVSAGVTHTCILKSNGNVECYGYNGYGKAENYTKGDAISVSAGYSHTCVLKSSGDTECYGYNCAGSTDDYTKGDVIGVSSGNGYTCVLKSDGNVDCYGCDYDGSTDDYTGGDAVNPFRKYNSIELNISSVGAEQLMTSTDSGGNYNYTMSAYMEAGTYTLKINLTDENGIYGENEIIFSVNWTSPKKPQLNSPEDGIYVNKDYAILNWTCVDLDGNSMTADIYGDSSTATTPINTTTNCLNGSSYTFNWTNMNETVYYWKVNCTDPDGSSNISDVYNFTVDLVPTVIINSPIPNTFLNSKIIIINLTATDTNLNYTNISIKQGNTIINSTRDTTNGTYTVVLSVPTDGIYNITATTYDTVGGINHAETRNVTIDATKPVITIQSPKNKTYNTISIWFNATLNEAGSWCGYSLDGAANVSMTNSTGNWNAQNESMTEGNHNAVFYCNDTAGNMDSANVSFIVSTTLEDCRNLTTANAVYYMNASIANSALVVCMNISAENITLDCLGNTINGTFAINGNSADNKYAIFSDQYNTTIKNCVISNWQNGIYLDSGANNSKIENNTIQNLYGAIGADGSPGDSGGNTTGIYSRSNFNTVFNNTISDITAGTGGSSTEGSGIGGMGGIATGIYISNSTTSNLTSNSISGLTGGVGGNNDFHGLGGGNGGSSIGIYLSDSINSIIFSNNIFSMNGGAGRSGSYFASTAGYGGISTGIYLINSTGNSIFYNNLSFLDGGAGGHNSCGGTHSGAGGHSTGISLSSDSTGNNISLNKIFSLTGGPGYSYGDMGGWHNTGGAGGMSKGVCLSNSTNNILSSNDIYLLIGGTGGAGGYYGSSGAGGMVAGNYIKDSINNTLSSNDIYSLTGGTGGAMTYKGYPGKGGMAAGNYIKDSINNTLFSNNIESIIGGSDYWGGVSSYFMYLYQANSTTIKDNTMKIADYGFYIYSTSDCLIYNNLVNVSASNPTSFGGTIYKNIWNTTKQFGTRIYFSGHQIGGNYWTNPTGTGYSDTCIDSVEDGFCSNNYTLAANNTDYLSLSNGFNYNFLPPTPGNNSALNKDWAYINVTTKDDSSSDWIVLEWNSTSNHTMDLGCFETNYYFNKTALTDGVYTYRVFANDSTGRMYVSKLRNLIVDIVTPPIISNLTYEENVYIDYISTVIKINVFDDSNVSSVWIEENSTGTPENNSMTFESETNDSIIYNYTLTYSSLGNILFKIYANDSQGNMENTSSYLIYVVDMYISINTDKSVYKLGEDIIISGHAISQSINITNNPISIWLDGDKLNLRYDGILKEDWGLSGWEYYKPVIIQNTAGSLSNWLVLIQSNMSQAFSDGKIQQDCSDIRYTTNTLSEYTYAISECNLAEDGMLSSLIKISLPNGNTTVYMFYGNHSANYAGTLWDNLWDILHLGIGGGLFEYNCNGIDYCFEGYDAPENYLDFCNKLYSHNPEYSIDMQHRLGVSTGSMFHTCILKSNGNVECYGAPGYGFDNYTSGDAISVSAGSWHTCILKSNGNVVCDGQNTDGCTNDYNGGDAVMVSAGNDQTCVLKSDANVECRGADWNGELRNYTNEDAIGVSVGGSVIYSYVHTCILKSDGNVECWGNPGDWSPDWGQDDNYTGGDAIGISAGGTHTCILKSDGNVTCYGDNTYGQANNYTGGDAIGVSAGDGHTCILKSDGNVTCYGDNTQGQANNYTGGDAIGVSAGGFRDQSTYTCILKSDGNVECWGNNGWSQAENYTNNDANNPFRTYTSSDPVSYTGAEQVTTTDSEGNYNYTIQESLGDGNHVLKVNLTDLNGYYRENETLFAIDAILPAINFINETTESGNYTQNYIEANVTVSDEHFDTVLINLYNLTGGLVQSNSSCVSPFFVNITGLQDGMYYLNATANDTAGNTNSTGTRTITLDTTPPSITIQSPIALTTYASSSIWFNITTDDVFTGTDWCGYSLDGAANVSMTNTSGNWNNLSAVAEGSHSVTFYANDTSGNMNASAARYFTVDGTAPTLSIINPTNASALAAGTASTTVNITTDENATCRYNLTNSTFAYADGTNFIVTGNTSHWFSYAVADGNTYSLYYKCNDTAGNINNQSAYHVFSVAAAVATTTPSSGGGGGGSISTTTKSIAVTPNEIITKIAVNLKIAVSSPAIFAAQVSAIPVSAPSEPVYQYLNITKSNFNNSNIENATIEFKVNKSWIAQNNITSVYLARYENGWSRLKTELINSTASQNIYRAYTDAFSYFAIAGEKAVAAQPIIPENITRPAAESGAANGTAAAGGTQTEQTGNCNIYVAIIAAIIFAALAAAAAFALRKQIARAVYRFLPENRKMLKAQKKRFEEMKDGLAKKDRESIKWYLDEGCAHIAKAEMDEAEKKE